MTEQELIELLSSAKHASWALWTKYLLSKCEVGTKGFIIPHEYVSNLRKQISTPYAELSEQEKQYDRDEVAHILPIIKQFVQEQQA